MSVTMSSCTIPPERWISQFDSDMQRFEQATESSLLASGDFLGAPWPYDIPRFLFGSGSYDLLGDIMSVNADGFRGVLLNEFKDYIFDRSNAFLRAQALFEEQVTERHSLVNPVVDLLPIALSSTSGLRRAHYDALCVAYGWIHEVENVKAMREGGQFPSMFITDECIFLFTVDLRGRIGEWLIENQDLWVNE